jgi:large subunit ribosomal protein L2
MKLKKILPKKSGRSGGKITVRHHGGRHKRFLRELDFKRGKKDVRGQIVTVEYDPNRNANIALVVYEDGERRYIIAPEGLGLGAAIIASEYAPVELGNAIPLAKIPAGTQVHNLEIRPGKGGQLVRGAGSAAVVQGREDNYVLVKLPSGELRRFSPDAWASIGMPSNAAAHSQRVGKAGINRRRGIRPTVRGVAQHPKAHPHGGGEGRSGIGLKYPKRYSGKPAVGRTRKKRKYSDKLIINRRKAGKHQKLI